MGGLDRTYSFYRSWLMHVGMHERVSETRGLRGKWQWCPRGHRGVRLFCFVFHTKNSQKQRKPLVKNSCQKKARIFDPPGGPPAKPLGRQAKPTNGGLLERRRAFLQGPCQARRSTRSGRSTPLGGPWGPFLTPRGGWFFSNTKNPPYFCQKRPKRPMCHFGQTLFLVILTKKWV